MGGAGSKQEEEGRRQNLHPRPSSSSWDSGSGYPGIPSYGPPQPQQYPGIPSYGPPQSNPSQQYPGISSYAPSPATHPQQQYHDYPPYGQESQSYGRQESSPSQQSYPPPREFGSGGAADNRKKFERRYSRIADNYTSLEQVTEALARAGLESSNLIIGIDFTKSNEWTGAKSFNRRSLHHIGGGPNPYEQAMSIIGTTLSAFDEDNLIPCYGFGDASTHDQDVFSFYPDERYCNGFEEVLSRYREIVPQLKLAGPTSFAPIIEMAMTIVEKSGGQYHVLLIIADGQVTRSVDTEKGQLSPQEQKTVDAIVEASKFPLSIILVGVGDGPWDTMKQFDDNIPARDFDNFQFVNFTEIMSKNVPQTRKETEFALTALMEVPAQYKATIELKILGSRKFNAPQRVPLPPPVNVAASFSSLKSFEPAGYEKPSYPPSYEPSVPTYPGDSATLGTAPPAPSISYDQLICPICLSSSKDMAFGCGHQTCSECARDLQSCPICRSPIGTRIKLY